MINIDSFVTRQFKYDLYKDLKTGAYKIVTTILKTAIKIDCYDKPNAVDAYYGIKHMLENKKSQ